MSDFLMDPNTNEMVIRNGDLVMARGDAAILQDCMQQLQLYLGEWFLDTTQGIPYRQIILVKNPNLDLVQATLQSRILAVNGVTDLLSFSFNFSGKTRGLSVAFSARTTNGTVIKAQSQVGV
jgi:hypothetical protein